MENKEPKTVRLSTVVLLFIILILIIALVLMYMHYNKDAKNEVATNTNKPEPMNTTNNTNVEESDRKELSITSSTVEDVYGYIPVIDESVYEEATNIPNAYQSKKITCDDLESKLLLANAYFNSDINLNDEKYTDGMDSKIVTELAFKNYNKEIKPTSFSSGDVSLNYENGVYNFSNGGYTSTYIGHVRNIEEAYEENDELYIIDTYIMYISKSGDIQEGDESETFEIYDSSERKKIVAEDEIENRDNIDDIDEYINKKFSTKAKKYKHTFKKNDDGEYYWYSSELYNEEF